MEKFIEKHSRSTLGEGRSYGLGCCLVKKTKDGFETAHHTITACKDFLNEVIYTERTKLPSYAHGLNCIKSIGLFEDCDKAYFAIKFLDNYNDGTHSAKFLKDENYFLENINNTINFINQFNDILNLQETILHKTDDEKVFILETDLYWTKNTYLVSLYTLIMRNGSDYTGGDIFDYCKKDMSVESMLKGNIDKIKKNCLETLIDPEQEVLSEFKCPHNMGILHYLNNKK
jgi:hypothetical protein